MESIRTSLSSKMAWLLFLVLLLVPHLSAYGQGVSASAASISGTISDPSGGAVPNAVVAVTNKDTGSTTNSKADPDGHYEFHYLAPGPYSLSATALGFKTKTLSNISLIVGQQATLDVHMEIGTQSETVDVTDEAPIVNSTASALSYFVSETKIRDLPLNGRDFVQLAELQPGVNSIGGISGDSQVTTGSNGNTNGGKFSINGLPSKSSVYLIDGSDVSDPFGLVPTLGGVTGAALGVDAIKEFRVISANYRAEYGRKAGGVIEAITRNGTNEFHGSLFEFHRNSALDAKNYFDDPSSPIPNFIRNQFGGAIVGPIRKDETFFFFNYEGLRERLGVTQKFVTPNAEARNGFLPDPSNPGSLINVGVDPRIEPFLNLFPLPNGADLGDGTGVVATSAVQPITEDFAVLRVDHKLRNSDHLFGRYLFDDGRSTNPFESTTVPGFPGRIADRNQFFTVSEQHVISPAIVNEAQFSTTPGLGTSLVPGLPTGQIVTSGLPLLGNAFILPIGEINNTFQFTDSASIQKRSHFIKFGADIRRVQNNGPFALGLLGQYQFPNLASFLEAKPTVYLGAVPGNADSNRSYRYTDWGFYVQDDYRLKSNLTLNLGLRYEGSSDPTEAHGRIANVLNPFSDTQPTQGKLLNSPKNLFGPRLGVAWSPRNNLSVRAGYGIFYSFLEINEYSDTRFLSPFYELALSINPPFLNPLSGSIVIEPLGETIPTQYNYKQPTVQHYNLSIQRQLGANTAVQIAYVGSHGTHLLRSGNANTVEPETLPDGRTHFPPGAPRINPAFGPILYLVTDANSSYNSLQLSFEQRATKGLTFQGSYTYSHSIDDASGGFLSDFATQSGPVQNFACLQCDRGSSAWDLRHNFVFNWNYDLPLPRTNRFTTGWSVGGIAVLSSGMPFTPVLGFNNSGDGSTFLADRPDVVGPCKILGTPDHWFDPSCFRLPPANTYGNAGRDILVGPRFANLDFLLAKQTKLSERIHLDFRAEVFNIFNHPSFAPPINSTGFNGKGGNGEIIFNDTSGVPLASAGTIFKTVNTSRQIQLGLKLLF